MRLYEAHYDRIYRFCWFRLYTPEAAEDATATVFLRLAEKIGELSADDDDRIGQWLYGTARNAVAAYLRDDARRNKVLSEVWRHRADLLAGRASGDGDTGAIDRTSLYEALLRLAPVDQDIITLRFFEQMAFREVARVLDMNQVTVKVRLIRALRKMRRYLASGGTHWKGVCDV